MGKRRRHQHVAAVTAITARGPAAGYKLLSAEGYATVAAVSRFHSNSCFVNEHFCTKSTRCAVGLTK
jgi:hypothetical protein